jgi:hypothetical protein
MGKLETEIMNVRIIDPTTDARWDEFVARQPHSSVFHTAAWARVIREAYGYLPRYYVLENDAGIEAAIPFYFISSRLTGKRLVCLPFSDYCWPLGEEEADILLLLDSAKKKVGAGEASYLEIRGWQNGGTPINLIPHEHYLRHFIDLEPDIDAVRQRFQHGVKKRIRRAGEHGVTARLTSSQEGLNHFYRLHISTRQKLGVLPQPYIFFKLILHHLISQGLGFIAIGECEGKVIAALVCLTHKGKVYSKFSASDKNHLNKNPNHVVRWEAIRYACANNYKAMDFGRCSPEDNGLRTFKLGWGAKEIDLPYFYYPEIKGPMAAYGNGTKYRVLRSVLSMMPQSALKAAGSLLYKHLA